MEIDRLPGAPRCAIVVSMLVPAPARLDEAGAEELLESIARLGGVPDAIDCSRVRFADPYGVLVLLAIGLSAPYRRGRAWGLVLPRDTAVLSWLDRCGARRLIEQFYIVDAAAGRRRHEPARQRPRPGAPGSGAGARGGGRPPRRLPHQGASRRAPGLAPRLLRAGGGSFHRCDGGGLPERRRPQRRPRSGACAVLPARRRRAGDPTRGGRRRDRRARQPRAALRRPSPRVVGRPGRGQARLPARGDRERRPGPRPGPRRSHRHGSRLGRHACGCAAARRPAMSGRTRRSAAALPPSPAPRSPSPSPRQTANKGPSAALRSSRLPAAYTVRLSRRFITRLAPGPFLAVCRIMTLDDLGIAIPGIRQFPMRRGNRNPVHPGNPGCTATIIDGSRESPLIRIPSRSRRVRMQGGARFLTNEAAGGTPQRRRMKGNAADGPLSSARGGGDEGDRTPDLCVANAALSQLSYIPTATTRRPTRTPPESADATGILPQTPPPGKTFPARAHFQTSSSIRFSSVSSTKSLRLPKSMRLTSSAKVSVEV